MDVGGWLRSLGLAQYEPMFRAHEIDGEVLPELNEGDLEKLGMPLGHRKRLMKAIAALGGPSAAPAEKISAPIESAPREGFVTLADFTCFYCVLKERPVARFQRLSLAGSQLKTAFTCSM